MPFLLPPLAPSLLPLLLGFLCLHSLSPSLSSPLPPLAAKCSLLAMSTLSPCSGLFWMPLAVLSPIPTIKIFPSSVPWSSRDLLFYVWCRNPPFTLRSCMLYLGNGVVYSFPRDLGLPSLRIGGLWLLEQGQAWICTVGGGCLGPGEQGGWLDSPELCESVERIWQVFCLPDWSPVGGS